MNYLRIIMVVFFCSVSTSAHCLTTKDPLYVDLSKTLGFITGQDYSLNRIKSQYPDLAARVKIAELEFNTSFGIGKKGVTKALQGILKEKYQENLKTMQAQIKEALSTQQLTHDIADGFIAEVVARAKGEIPSPILETLLIYEFENSPSEEFSRGYTKVFLTKDHPKSKGVNCQIRYPASWQAKEGERPNIIQKFVSQNGRSLEMFLIMVKELPLPPGYIISKQEMDEFFVESELKGLVPEGGSFISAKPIVLDNHQGGMIFFDHTLRRLDQTITSRNLNFVTILRNKMIFIQCMVFASPGKQNELKEHFNKFEALFKMIGNSFIIQEQYK